MTAPNARKLRQGLISGAAGIVLSLGLWVTGVLDRWEAITWDWRASLMAVKSPAGDQITLILLDQNSLDWGQKENGLSWPWPRELYAAVVEYCQRSGARSLAFDVLFTEPSSYGVNDDQSFSKAAESFGKVAGSVSLGHETGNQVDWPKGIKDPIFRVIPLDNPIRSLPTFPRAAFPVPELASSMNVLCNTHMNPDSDGIYRSAPIAALFDGRMVPTLGIGAFLSANPSTTIREFPGGFTIGDQTIPVSKDGNAILRFNGPAGTYRSFSAAAVLQSELRLRSGMKPTIDDLEAFRDKYVLFGFTAPGLFDLRPTPLDGVTPGVEIQATILDNLLSGTFIHPCPLYGWITATLILIMVAGIAGSIFSTPTGHVLVSIIFLCMPAFAALWTYALGWSLPLVVPEIGIGAALFTVFIINYSTEGRQKRFIQGAFKQYLSPAVIDQLILHPEKLKLGGERRVLSIFFSDLEGFTSISEKLDPEALTALLNEYLSAMTEIIHEEAGTVDKFEGDAIIAFWNAPLAVEDHPVRVVRAALRCQEKLKQLNPQLQKRSGREFRMRIGIHTGSAVVGNMGSHSRFDYTMLGDSVNLAARLEGANKAFGTYVMISETTRMEIGNMFPVRELARLTVVGRKEPITVYEPMLPVIYEQCKTMLDIFDQGLKLFYSGRFMEAAEVFTSISDQDPPADRYLTQCRQYESSPPDNRDGVWVMTSK
jgi:adenylate cyclase